MSKWIKEGFESFRKGTFGNGGQNIYVSKKGILQRIHNFDVDANGYPDIPYANSHNLRERQPVKVYTDLSDLSKFTLLPTNGAYDGLVCDLNGDGYDDLVIACQNNGTHADNEAIIYYGSEFGLTEDYKSTLYAPDAIGVTVGDYNANGKKDLCFLCNGVLKIFTQNDRGFHHGTYYEVKNEAGIETVYTYDINGDGYDDIYVKLGNGSSAVYWGSADGIKADAFDIFVKSDEVHNVISTSTAGRRHVYEDWKTCVMSVNGNTYLFRGGKTEAEFYTYADGKFTLAFSYACKYPRYAVAADFDGDGQDDILILCSEDRDKTDDSYVLWNKGGKFGEDVLTFTTQSARSATTVTLDGKLTLAVAQSGNHMYLDFPILLITFDGRAIASKKEVMSEDCPRVLFGHFDGKEQYGMVTIQHESGCFRGLEEVAFFLGDKDGYRPDRSIRLPGVSAIDLRPIDFNDDGYPDALVSNCNENWPREEPGSYLYWNGPDGFDKNNKTVIPTIRNHGSAIGDFNHNGYLDIVTGGIANREIRILRGGPDGYSEDNMERVVFGPNPDDSYRPTANILGWGSGEGAFSDEEVANNNEFGHMRWNFAADFNGDGWLDVFVSVIGSGYGYILWNGPEGFSLERSTKLNAEGAICATVADLNKNGYPDLIIGCHYNPFKPFRQETNIIIYWGGPDGYVEHRKTVLPAFAANSVTVGDFNGNGWLDIYATSYNNGRRRDLMSYIYLNDNGHFSVNRRQMLYNHSGSGCFAGDFNGDGYCDLAVASHKDEGDHRTTSYIYWGGPNGLNDLNRTEVPTVGPHGMSSVDPGNLMDRGDREYYVSEAYDVPSSTASITYEAEFISTSWLELEYRCGACDKCLEKAEWKKVEAGEKFKVEGKMQYRLSLCAKCGCGTPRVSKVTVDFE